MTVGAFLNESVHRLKIASVPSYRLDAEVLISETLGVDKSWLLAHEDEELTSEQTSALERIVNRRSNHEPVAYILGSKEFYGRDFYVNKDVLVPRPESETMIELLLNQIGDWRLEIEDGLQIVDIGTGSGNLIITAKLEMPKVESRKSKVSYIGLDISKTALEIAKRNAKNLKANVDFKHFDLLKDNLSLILSSKFSICILANLPYVPTSYPINEPAKQEPKIALFSGDDGLYYYRQLFKQMLTLTANGLLLTVFTEALPFQHAELVSIAKSSGFKLTESKDLIQVFTRPSTC